MSTRRAAPRSKPKPARPDPRAVAERLLARADPPLSLVSIRTLQTLWAGYGHICAVAATDPKKPPGNEVKLILKLIAPPAAKDGDGDEGHKRKMLSYAVEQYFYARIAPALPADVAVAQCIAMTPRGEEGDDGNEDEGDSEGDAALAGVMGMLLSDLSTRFPIAGEHRAELARAQVSGALRWLAGFHAASWRYLPNDADLPSYVRPPLHETRTTKTKVWLNGGYTYLATRTSEFRSLEKNRRSEWSAAFTATLGNGSGNVNVAETAARALAPRGRREESLIHGDVKSENLFARPAGDVAFVDFQYVGLGLGVCDLAKLFTCSVPLELLTTEPIPDKLGMEEGERRLLEEYRTVLLARAPDGRKYDWDTFVRHWETALVDWCRFQASWGFWGNTEWLEARTRAVVADEGWRAWVVREAAAGGGV